MGDKLTEEYNSKFTRDEEQKTGESQVNIQIFSNKIDFDSFI